MPERAETGAAAELEAEDVIDGVLNSGSPRSIVDLLMEHIPARFQQNEEVQGIIEQMRAAEKQYLPLIRDLQQTELMGDFQYHLPRMIAVLFVVGLVVSVSLPVGVLAFIAAAGVLGIYLLVRRDVMQELHRETETRRDDLIKYWIRLTVLETWLTEQEKIG